MGRLSVVMLCMIGLSIPAFGELKSFKVEGDKLLVNGEAAKLWGVRMVCAAAKDEYTSQLIENLKDYHLAGVNAILVCYQGGPGMTQRTFTPDGTSFEETATRDRMRKIIDAAARHDTLVIVSLFFPRKMGLNSVDPKLATREAYLAACKTAAEELKDKKNVILSVYDQPIPTAFGALPMKFMTADIAECLGVVALAAPNLPRGGGSSNHEANVTLARNDAASVILHAEPGPNPPAFPVKKPIIHVAYFGSNDTAGKNPQGFYHPAARQSFSDYLDRFSDASTAHFLVHLPAWYEGAMDMKTNRFDLGGSGTAKDPGVRWYFEALERRAKKRSYQAGPNPTSPKPNDGSIFDFNSGPIKKK